MSVAARCSLGSGVLEATDGVLVLESGRRPCRGRSSDQTVQDIKFQDCVTPSRNVVGTARSHFSVNLTDAGRIGLGRSALSRTSGAVFVRPWFGRGYKFAPGRGSSGRAVAPSNSPRHSGLKSASARIGHLWADYRPAPGVTGSRLRTTLTLARRIPKRSRRPVTWSASVTRDARDRRDPIPTCTVEGVSVSV